MANNHPVLLARQMDRSFHENANRCTLLDVKNILVFCTIGRALIFLAIAMQVKHINGVEALHEAAAHAAEGGIIQVAMVGDEGQDAIARALDAPLSKTNEFHVIIVEPFDITLAKRLTVNLEVAIPFTMQEAANPGTIISGMAGIWWVADDHHNRSIIFGCSCLHSLFNEPLGKGKLTTSESRF